MACGKSLRNTSEGKRKRSGFQRSARDNGGVEVWFELQRYVLSQLLLGVYQCVKADPLTFILIVLHT